MENNLWNYSVFWKETLNQIKESLSEQEWFMWFTNIEYNCSKESEIILNVPSSFYRDQVKQRYLPLIEEKLFSISGHKVKISFLIKDNNSQNKDKSSAANTKTVLSASSPKKKDHPQLNKEYDFNTFVIGENNSFAANAAYAISKNPGTSYNPCLIYGGVGLGKTHLLQSIGNSSYSEFDNIKIVYVTAESFTNGFIKALKDNKIHQFKNKYRSVDVLLIDDIHFLQNKQETQEELFHTFNALYDAKKQMVFTCDRPVSELKNLTSRLKSRFERGLNVDLQPPNFETRYAILKKKVENLNSSISDDVISLISKNITTNIRDLEAALTKLIAYSELVNKNVTPEVAKQQLKAVFSDTKQTNITIELVQRVVADYFGLVQNDLRGKRKTKRIVLPRQIAMHIVRELTEYSTTEVGIEFGGRDHTTVMHACMRIESRKNSDPTLEPTIQNLIRNIKEYGINS